jgi:hypothetical protein
MQAHAEASPLKGGVLTVEGSSRVTHRVLKLSNISKKSTIIALWVSAVPLQATINVYYS